MIGPLVILIIGLYPIRLGFALGAYHWLGADALWISFPVSSTANMAMALGYYLYGGWKNIRLHIPPRAELEEEAIGDTEPGGRINPAG